MCVLGVRAQNAVNKKFLDDHKREEQEKADKSPNDLANSDSLLSSRNHTD